MSPPDIATLLPVAIGFALSPAAIIELILVLFSQRRVTNSIVFVIALVVTASAALVLGALGSSASGGTGGGASTAASWVFVIFGLLLVAMGVSNWRKRSDTSEPAALFFPPSILAGALVGGAAGAVIGEVRKVHHKNELADELVGIIGDDQSGLIALVTDPRAEKIEKALDKADRIVTEAVDKATADELRKAAKDVESAD